MNVNRRTETRISRLETHFCHLPVILHFADGSTREIPGSSNQLLDLVLATWGDTLDARQRICVEWVRQSEYATEPGGSRMTEMIRCFLDGHLLRSVAAREPGDALLVELFRAILSGSPAPNDGTEPVPAGSGGDHFDLDADEVRW